MVTTRDAVGVTAFLVGAAVLAAVNHHPTHGRRSERERAAVHGAAGRLTHQQIADAWTRTELGDATSLHAIQRQIPLEYRAAHQEGDAIILTFAGHGDRCIDLLSRPDGTSVRTRPC